MEALEQDFGDFLLRRHEPPCLSLYQPTHRHHPDNRQDQIDETALRQLGWEAERPRYLALTAELVDRFRSAQSSGKGSDELTRVAAAAAEGRIATLLLDADQDIPGRVDALSGAVELADAPDADDLLDDLGELVLKRGGRAIVIPQDRMPTRSGVAAIYRY